MCDDFYDGFDDDFDGEPGDYGDDSFCDDNFEDTEQDGGDPIPEADAGSWDGLRWQDWMIIGPLSEEIAREKRKKWKRFRKKW